MGKVRRNVIKDFSKMDSENKKLAKEIEESVNLLNSLQEEEVDPDGILFCSVDGTKCVGKCRDKNSKRGVLSCFAAYDPMKIPHGPTY